MGLIKELYLVGLYFIFCSCIGRVSKVECFGVFLEWLGDGPPGMPE